MDRYSHAAPRWVVMLVVTLLVPAAAVAQFQTGNVFGTVMDNQGQALPGATVTLTGLGAPKVFISDADGHFRFLSLPPGRYSIKAELSGFGSVTREAEVSVGTNTTVELTLAPALEAVITVTAETPILDVRRTGTGATIPQIELEQIPTARDPWVVLQQVPGVVMDRINVGGNESGQQSQYVGKGTYQASNLWSVDGVTITDPAASGSSPTYYDFDAFQEMQATTGGSDPRLGTPGVGLNLVTKRGTNEWHGSGRFFLTDSEFQEDPEIPAEARDYLAAVNEIDQIQDYGLELGGPVLRDRLWLWGSYGKNEIDNLVAGSFGPLPDSTTLENYSGKLNAQITSNNSGTAFYFFGDKIKTGRSASPVRPAETTWNQSGPTDIWKFEDTHIFSPNFFLSGLYARIDGGFQLLPQGGGDTEMYRDVSNVFHGSFLSYSTDRPQDQYRVDGSGFFDTGALNHELRFGFSYADTPVTSSTFWPGTGNYHRFRGAALCGALGLEAGCTTPYVTRETNSDFEGQNTDFYIGDTILMGNLTLQLGLRYDKFNGRNNASSAGANPVAPDLLPALDYPGDEREFEQDAISARIGATYSLGTARRTLIRGAYNQYASAIGAAGIKLANPFYYTAIIIFPGRDLNGDNRVQRNEIFDHLGYLAFAYVDPADPDSILPPTRLDYDADPTRTNEIILGVEHELLPQFSVGLAYTNRKIDDIFWEQYEKTPGSNDFYTSADFEVAGFVEGTSPQGDTYRVPYYRVKQGVPTPVYAVYTNRPDYEQNYDSIELTMVKRLSGRWMLRGNVTWSDWTQNVGPGGIQDPTPQRLNPSLGCTTCDDEIVFQESAGSGSKQDIFINSGWSYNLTGLYQLPWDFSIGASLSGREGYPLAYAHTAFVDGQEKEVMIPGIDENRYEDIFNLDLRLAKEFRFADRVGLTLSADVFNVTDERTVLQRDSILYTDVTDPSGSANNIRELQSPRVIRFGARLSF